MKTKLISFWPPPLPALLGLAALLFAAGGQAQTSTTTSFRYTGTDFEGRQLLQLEWPALSNATYVVQSATDLAVADAWKPLDLVTPTNGAGQYEVKAGGTTAEFFRLALPQPQIFSIEPAIFPPGVAVDVSVIGQCFESNDVVQVNGAPKGGVIFYDHSLLRFTLSPPSAGVHLVQLIRNGVVRSSFTVVCADALTKPELVLQGPPTFDPPASPSAKEGHAGEKIEFAWETLELKGMVAPPGGAGEVDGFPGVSAAQEFTADDFRYKVDHKRVATVSGNSYVEDFRYKVDHKRVVGGGGNVGVVPFSGEVQAFAVDLVIPGRELNLVWARIYHSRLGRSSAPNGWTFSYDVSCAQNSAGGIDVSDGTGRKDTFTPGTNGVYTCPELFREGTISNNTFTLTFADTGRWVFNPFDGSPTAGLVREIITRNGSTIKLTHNAGSGRLEQIIDDLGRTNTVGYNTAGQLASFTDFSGRTVSYQYYQGLPADQGGAGDLKSVTSPPVTGTPNGNDFPQGKTVSYTYTKGFPLALNAQNHLLLSCVDALGQTTTQFNYDLSTPNSASYLRCLSVRDGSYPLTTISYLPQIATPSNRFATLRSIVNDPIGNVTESFFDARGRCVQQQEFTGRAAPGVPVTDTGNRPTEKLRNTDPECFETRWTWNNDSLCTSEISPGGSRMQYVYQSDFDPATPARKRADCRVVREIASSPVDLDGDGVAETSDRTWHFDFDPRFGSEPGPMSVAYHAVKTKGTGANLGMVVGGKDLSPRVALSSAPAASLRRDGSRNPWRGTVSSGAGLEVAGVKLTPRLRIGYSPVARTKYKGWDGLIYGTHRVGFPSRETDPRGNVTEFGYDASGNATTQKIKLMTVRTTWNCAYDPHGQLTAITNAPDANGYSRVDTFAWSQGQVTQCVVDAGGLALTSAFEYDARGNLTRYVDPRTNDWLFAYNTLAQCVRVQSPPNISARCATDFAYDANDNLVACTTQLRDAADNLVGSCVNRASYDSLHQLTELALAIDASRALTNRFVYDANGQCVQVLGADAVSGADPHQTVVYQNDERGLPFREVVAPGSPLQLTAQLDYDASGNPTRVSEGLEGTPSVTTIAYDGFSGFENSLNQISGVENYVKLITDGDYAKISRIAIPYGNEDSSGSAGKALKKGDRLSLVGFGSFSIAHRLKVWQLMQGQSGTQAMRSNQPIVTKDVDNITTDGKRLAKITDPMGNVTTFHYDANDNLKVIRRFGETNDVPGTNGNIRLAETRFDYDGLDRCVVRHDLHFHPATQAPVGDGEATTRIVFAPNGHCLSVTDDLGRLTTCDYDTAGRAFKVKVIIPNGTPAGNVKKIKLTVYDRHDNVVAITETNVPDLGEPPQVFTTTYAYDNLNRCVSTSDNVGNASACAYDSLARGVRVTDARGNDTTYSYDLLGNCLASVSYAGSSSVQPATVLRSSSATYDSNLRCASATDANGNPTSYAYDTLGHCTAVVYADGTRVQKSWFPANFRTIESDPNGTTITNSYDLCGRLIRRDIAVGSAAVATTTFETFAYDGCDRLTAHANNDATGSVVYDSLGNRVRETLNGLATVSTCDALGNRRLLAYPGSRVLTYTYDAASRCTGIVESGASVASFDYTGSRLSRAICANGVRTVVSYNGLTGTPNATGDQGFGQVSRVRHMLGQDCCVIIECRSGYDQKQNKTFRTVAIPAAGGRTNDQLFAYDALDQLVQSAEFAGTTLLRNTAYGLDAVGNRTNVIGAALCSGNYTLNTGSAPFDLFMNRYTTTPCEARSYDANGNLVSRGSSAGLTVYAYDYADRLVFVADTSSGNLAPVASYAYDALGRRVRKTLNPGTLAAITRLYCYDGSCVIEERQQGAVAASFIQVDSALVGMRLGTQDYFVHTDDQGNTLALTDASGAVAECYEYDDYGAVTFLTSAGVPTGAASSAVGNPYCWGGLRLDAETGLHTDDNGDFFEPQSGRPTRAGGNGPSVYILKPEEGGRHTPFQNRLAGGNNPWSPPAFNKVKALGANGEGKKEFVGHVSLLK